MKRTNKIIIVVMTPFVLLFGLLFFSSYCWSTTQNINSEEPLIQKCEPVEKSVHTENFSKKLSRDLDETLRKLDSLKYSGKQYEKFVDETYSLLENRIKWIESQRLGITKKYKNDGYLDSILDKSSPYYKKCKNYFKKTFPKRLKSQGEEESSIYNNFFQGRKDGFYVEFGAYAPESLSNSYFFDMCLGWKGICIEANPDNFKKWKNTKRRATIINKCVSNKKESLTFESHGPTTKMGSSGDVSIECDTLDSILREAGIDESQKIDYMSVDCEGCEVKVFEGFDLDKWNVEVMVIEFTSIGPELAFYLEDKGYMMMYAGSRNFIFAKGITHLNFGDPQEMKKNLPKFGWDD